jgi:hypothetical protein
LVGLGGGVVRIGVGVALGGGVAVGVTLGGGVGERVGDGVGVGVGVGDGVAVKVGSGRSVIDGLGAVVADGDGVAAVAPRSVGTYARTAPAAMSPPITRTSTMAMALPSRFDGRRGGVGPAGGRSIGSVGSVPRSLT